MPLKVNIGLSKKIGQPDFGSLGASCHVEFELDGGYDNGSTEHFQNAVSRAYAACRQAVETEIGNDQPAPTSSTGALACANGIGGQHVASNMSRMANGERGNENGTASTAPAPRTATASQVRAIYAITKRSGVNLPAVLSSQFRVHLPENLSIRDASAMIDQLKSGQAKE